MMVMIMMMSVMVMAVHNKNEDDLYLQDAPTCVCGHFQNNILSFVLLPSSSHSHYEKSKWVCLAIYLLNKEKKGKKKYFPSFLRQTSLPARHTYVQNGNSRENHTETRKKTKEILLDKHSSEHVCIWVSHAQSLHDYFRNCN